MILSLSISSSSLLKFTEHVNVLTHSRLTTVKRMNDKYGNAVEGFNPKDAGGIVRATGMEDKVTWATDQTE